MENTNVIISKRREVNNKTQDLNIDVSYLKDLCNQIIKSNYINHTEDKLQYSDLLLCATKTQTIAGQLKNIFDVSCSIKYKAEKLSEELNRLKFDIMVEENEGSDLTY